MREKRCRAEYRLPPHSKCSRSFLTTENATEDNTLSFAAGAMFTVGATTGAGDTTIRSGITGSPNMTYRGRVNTAAFLALQPSGGLTMSLGTISVLNTYVSNNNLILGGASTNVVNKVTWTVTANQLALQKKGTGMWTIENNLTLNAGKIFVEDGVLIMAGQGPMMTRPNSI